MKEHGISNQALAKRIKKPEKTIAEMIEWPNGAPFGLIMKVVRALDLFMSPVIYQRPKESLTGYPLIAEIFLKSWEVAGRPEHLDDIIEEE
jgi:hypothetical protein